MISSSNLIPLREVSRMLPGNPHIATLHRWIGKGVLSNGRRIKLATKKIGGRRFVEPHALQFFVNSLSDSTNEVPTPRQIKRRIRNAETDLDRDLEN